MAWRCATYLICVHTNDKEFARKTRISNFVSQWPRTHTHTGTFYRNPCSSPYSNVVRGDRLHNMFHNSVCQTTAKYCTFFFVCVRGFMSQSPLILTDSSAIDPNAFTLHHNTFIHSKVQSQSQPDTGKSLSFSISFHLFQFFFTFNPTDSQKICLIFHSLSCK